MTLFDAYQAAIEREGLEPNPLQQAILSSLQQLCDKLDATKRQMWWLRKRKAGTIKGAYIYGPVGRGKTFLMDLFYDTVKEPSKGRFHFHAFMQQVDSDLRAYQGKENPVVFIGKKLAKTYRLLCLDECFVEDIADAMILGELFRTMFEHGVVMVITSNTHPDNLYLHGLQRSRFLPAIALIKQHCDLLALHYGKDYRTGDELEFKTFYYPANQNTAQKLTSHLQALDPTVQPDQSLLVQNRYVSAIQAGKRAVWFDFDVICNIPRSTHDYLELAESYDIWALSQLRAMTTTDTPQVVLFINLIDVLYDKRCGLILSSEVALEDLYPKGPVHKRFQRTLSRLDEMLSQPLNIAPE